MVFTFIKHQEVSSYFSEGKGGGLSVEVRMVDFILGKNRFVNVPLSQLVCSPYVLKMICCCRPNPPACSCGGVRQPNYFRAALPGVSST